MSTSISMLMGSVRALCKVGSPPSEPTQEVLSDSDILSAINDEQPSLTEAQVLSNQNQWLVQMDLGMAARNNPLNIVDYNEMVQVQYQVDSTYDRWFTIDNVNKIQLDDCENQNKLAYAVYGTPPILSFSFLPSVTLPMAIFRIWYETSLPDQLPASTPRLNPSFHNLLKYSVGIICREVYMGLPVNETLHYARDRYQAQYDKYANRSPDQRPHPKSPSYGSSVVDELFEPNYTW